MFGCKCVCVNGQVCLYMWVCMFHTLGFCFVGISPIQTCACVHTRTHTHTESIGYNYDLKDVSVFDDLTFHGRLFQTDGAAYEKDI